MNKFRLYYCYNENKIKITLVEENNAIAGLFFGNLKLKDASHRQTPLLKNTAMQIEEYLRGSRREFSVPLALHGTEFQKAVWSALQNIPYGETRSYQDIAVRIGRPKAVRAVGMANHCNQVSIIIPCHRVIGKDGSLTGYGGGLRIKQYLLDLEQNNRGF